MAAILPSILISRALCNDFLQAQYSGESLQKAHSNQHGNRCRTIKHLSGFVMQSLVCEHIVGRNASPNQGTEMKMV